MRVPLSPIIGLLDIRELRLWKRQWMLLPDEEKHQVMVILREYYKGT